MGYVNQGNQYITFDFKHKAKGYDFNRLNRNVLRKGIYRGMAISYAGNDVTISNGSVLFDTFYKPSASVTNDNIQTKIDFDATYTFSNLLPSDGTINPSTGTFYDEIIYLVYEYGEVTFNYADFRSTTIRAIETIEATAIIIGQVSFNLSQQITGFSYTNRTYGLFTYETGHALPDSTYFFNIDHPSLTTTKKWSIDGSKLSTGIHKFYIPNTTPINNGSVKEYDLLLTNTSNTALVKNNLQVDNRSDIKGILSVTGTTYLKDVDINGNGNINLKGSLNLDTSGTINHSGNLNVSGSVKITQSIIALSDLNVSGNLSVLNQVKINSTTDSLNKDTGALIIEGGLGVKKNLNVGAKTIIESQSSSSSIFDNALTVSGGLGVVKNVNVGGDLDVSASGSIVHINRQEFDYDTINNNNSSVTVDFTNRTFIVLKNNVTTTITLGVPIMSSRMRTIYLLVKSSGSYSFNLTTSQGGTIRWPSGYSPAVSQSGAYDFYSFVTNGTDLFATFAFNYSGTI